jgi:hypothetical protein
MWVLVGQSGDAKLCHDALDLGINHVVAPVLGGNDERLDQPLSRGSARADVSECSALLGMEHMPPLPEEFLFVLAKDIGDFQPMLARCVPRVQPAQRRLFPAAMSSCSCAVESLLFLKEGFYLPGVTVSMIL